MKLYVYIFILDRSTLKVLHLSKCLSIGSKHPRASKFMQSGKKNILEGTNLDQDQAHMASWWAHNHLRSGIKKKELSWPSLPWSCCRWAPSSSEWCQWGRRTPPWAYPPDGPRSPGNQFANSWVTDDGACMGTFLWVGVLRDIQVLSVVWLMQYRPFLNIVIDVKPEKMWLMTILNHQPSWNQNQ